MSFGPGWSPSDLVTLIQLIYNAYDTIKNVPDEYENLRLKFKDIERELKILDERLNEIGGGRFDAFSGDAELRKDLEAANEHLKQFEALDRKGTLRKLVSTAKFTFDARKTSQFSSKMDIHRKRLHSFRQDIILQATLRQLNAVQRPNNVPPLPHDTIQAAPNDTLACNQSIAISSDHASILTQARKSINLAKNLNKSPPRRPKQQLDTIPSNSPILTGAESGTVDDAIYKFIDNVVAQAEASKLYLKTAVPESHIKEFIPIAQWLDGIQKLVRESPKISTTNKQTNTVLSNPQAAQGPQPQTNSPEVAQQRAVHLCPYDRLQYIDPSCQTSSARQDPLLDKWWASSLLHYLDIENVRSLMKESGVPAADTSSPSPFNFHDLNNGGQDIDDDHGSTSTDRTSLPSIDSPARKPIEFASGTFICSPSTESQSMVCNIEISKSEGSICVWATIPGRLIPTSNQSSVHKALTPQAHLDMSPTNHNDGQNLRPMIVRHSLKPGLDNFPAVLHPTVEAANPNNPKAPFEISFYNAQFLDVEGRSWTADHRQGYKYAFSSRQDRDVVREHLFGKTLLSTAGYEESSAKISPCRIQAVSLWESHDQREPLITVTLPGRCRKRGPPDHTLEFQILGFKTLKKAAKDGQELVLKVEPISSESHGDSPPSRRESVLSTRVSTSDSGSTLQSKGSIRSRSATFMSVQIKELAIKLSDTTLAEKRDKKAFLKKLSEKFEPG